jgi:hypothetical protein
MTVPPSTRGRIALLAVLALVVLAGCAGAGDGMGSEPPAAGSGDRAADQASGAGGASVGSFYHDGERVVVREANVTLRVENFSRAFARVHETVDAHGGYLGDRSQRGDGE